jgi:hypothetical protein
MTDYKNEKANDSSRWPNSNDRTGQGAIKPNNNPEPSAKLVLMLSLLQRYQVMSCEYALETDHPAWGAVEAADFVDAAYDELAFALLEGACHE